MAEPISIQQLKNASEDANSLGEAVNGDENSVVTTRLGETYPTLANALNQIDGQISDANDMLVESVTTLFENGGLPATPFKTKALMTASALSDGEYSMVTDDGANNGLYQKLSGAWVLSAYNPMTLVKKEIELLDKRVNGIIEPTWELGSISTPNGGALNSAEYLNRARISPLKTLVVNKTVTAKSNNPEIVVGIVSWDADGNYTATGGRYANTISRKITHSYNVMAKYYDDRFFELSDVVDAIEVTYTSTSEEDILRLSESTELRVNYLETNVFGGNLEPTWEIGSFLTTGELWEKPEKDTLRLVGYKLPLNAKVVAESLNSDMQVKILEFDADGNYIWHTDRGVKVERHIKGYFNILVSWVDGRAIAIEDADLVIRIVQDDVDVVEDLAKLSDLIMTGEYNAEWEIGSFLTTGELWEKPEKNRLRLKGTKVRFKGLLTAESLNRDMQLKLMDYDSNGDFVGGNQTQNKVSKYIDGYFNFVLSWKDDRLVSVEDAEVRIELNTPSQDGGSGSGSSEVGLEFNTPLFSTAPYGNLINKTLLELQTEFDSLVARYPHTSNKEVIGVSTDGLHDIHGYTLTPDNYEAVIAITMHTHGNERLNPLGFFSLLDMFGKSGQLHPLIYWLRDKVKWYVVPFVSPTAVVANTRNTGSVNVNRDFDYLLYETNTQPYTSSEARALYEYFKPKRHEIGFNLDLHDIPEGGANTYSYNVPHHTHFLWLEEQRAISKYLANINNGVASLTYTSNAAAIRSMFLGSFGIPSATPEHVTMWWVSRGFSPDQQVAKSLEQICAYLYLYKEKLEQDTKYSSLYTRKFEASFASVEDGNPSWSREQVLSAFEEIDFLTRVGDKFINNNEGSRTILIVSGVTADTNNSDLTLLRVLQRVSLGNEMLLEHLKNANLVIVPSILNGGTESSVKSEIQSLIAQHNPYYTLVVQSDNLTAPVGRTIIETPSLSNVTRITKESGVEIAEEQSELLQGISARYTHIKLKNEVDKHAHYPHTVANWVGLVANDLASVFSEV